MSHKTIINVQKTYCGHTAGGWLQYAEVRRSLAGPWCIWAGGSLGTIMRLRCDGTMHITDGYDAAILHLFPRAARRLSRLERLVEKKNAHDHRNDSTTNPNTKEN